MSDRTDQLLDEIVRILALSVRQGMGNQTEAINLFLQAGIDGPRVAELLGTSPAVVRAIRSQTAKKTAGSKSNHTAGKNS